MMMTDQTQPGVKPQQTGADVVKCKAKIYKLSDNKSAELIIHKTTLPSNAKLKDRYDAIMITAEGVVKFNTNTLKHKHIIRYKIPLSIARVYLKDRVTEVDVYVKDNTMLIIQSNIDVQKAVESTEDDIKK